jgi:hypothetical protein
MKMKIIFSGFALIVFSLSFVTTGFAQSTQCVVDQIQGSLVTLSCPGVGTRVENVGGAADRYKVGDTIAAPTPTQGQGANDQRSAVDPRSGRR